MLSEEIANISSLSWMKRREDSLILLIVVGDMGERGSETIRNFRPNSDLNGNRVVIQIELTSSEAAGRKKSGSFGRPDGGVLVS
jgi:hypothetical protein